MRLFIPILIATVFCAAAMAQRYPEVEALKEYFFAEDVDTLAKHLPQEFVDRLNEFPKSTRRTILAKFFLASEMRKEGAKLFVPDGPPVLLRIERQGQRVDNEPYGLEISLEKRISDGYEALLKLGISTTVQQQYLSKRTLLVWLRHEYGGWRIISATSDDGLDADFEKEEFVSRVLRRPMEKMEKEAAEWAEELQSAIVRYLYRDEGELPDDLMDLSKSEIVRLEDGSEETYALLYLGDRTSPYEVPGYHVSYYRAQGGDQPKFELILRPKQYGVTGKRSFFADESGHLRWTDEDRAARADDPILN